MTILERILGRKAHSETPELAATAEASNKALLKATRALRGVRNLLDEYDRVDTVMPAHRPPRRPKA
jgi:hypothetical protein